MDGPSEQEPSGSASVPALASPDPLGLAWRRAVEEGRDPAAREDLLARYAFAIPGEAALEGIRRVSPLGVVEIGAGTGYWARLLHERGVDVVAVDKAPASSPDNTWFSESALWFAVAIGDETAVDEHRDRTLLLVWPTRNEDWAADAVQRYAAAGGATLAYVGERLGGRTGDDRFHALIGEVDRCWSCAYGTATTPCVCGITPVFRPVESIEIPQWQGFEDDLRLYQRAVNAEPLTASPPQTSRPVLELLRPRRLRGRRRGHGK